MSSAYNNHRRGDAGVTSMEVAISFALFVMLVFGVIDLSRYFFTQQALTTLVNITARQAYAHAQNPQVPSQAQIASYAPLLDPTLLETFTVTLSQTPGLVALTVTAKYNYTPLTPLFGTFVGPLTATVTYQF
jgi:Flp pilus assembly protein TadG